MNYFFAGAMVVLSTLFAILVTSVMVTESVNATIARNCTHYCSHVIDGWRLTCVKEQGK